MKFGLVGPTYTNQSRYATGERCINLYPEAIESPSGGKGGASMMMLKIPGLKRTHELPDKPLRGLYSTDGLRCFAVSGATLYEIFANGTFTALGMVERSTQPAQMFANGGQLFVISGSGGYIANGVNVTRVTDACMGFYLDGYFGALEGAQPGESKLFKISALLDGTSWNPLDFAAVEGAPDNILAILANHRQLEIFKYQDIEFFWDSGNPDFPIERIDGSFVEQGCAAAWSPRRIDNTSMWLGADERGAGIAWNMQGYTPSRASTHGVENVWQGYQRAGIPINDAVGVVEQVQGHQFYHLHFPTADATWTYDRATRLWHERGSWDSVNGVWHAHKARYHCYAFNRHLVGGGDATGYVYDQSIDYQDDDGQPLRWLRSAPHIADAAGKRVFYSNLWIDFQQGVGVNTLVGVDGKPRQPVCMVRHSNDGGNNWGNEAQLPIGKIGEFSGRALQPMCGSGRARAVEVSGTDPVQIAIVDADIQAQVGLS